MSAKTKINVYWFRKALRLHDNVPLLQASKSEIPLLPIFILDPLFLPETRDENTVENATGALAGQNQFQFLMESLTDLDQSLKRLSSRLVIFMRQTPEQAFSEILKHYEIDTLYFEKDSEPYAKERDAKICELLEGKANISSRWGHTLTDLDQLHAQYSSVPKMYRSFLKQFSPALVPQCAPTVNSMPKLPFKFSSLKHVHKSVPTITEIGFPPIKNLTPYRGGETEALKRLKTKMKNRKWVAQFEKPQTNPAALEPSTTVLSPYLCHGCLSARHFYHEVEKVYAKSTSHAQPPQSLHGQLYFREWFYLLSYIVQDFDKMKGNELCLQVDWDSPNEKYLEAFKTGKTGFPWIDAIMRQLIAEGWIHHLARHSVACFLTRGQLWQNWEEGKKIFAEYLLDGDYALNSANWMWLSASAFFTSYFRVYGVESWPKKYDKNGDFVRKYVPELKKMPKKYIYCPHKAPIAVQKQANCIIGKDYPKPICDDRAFKERNMGRMKAAYARKQRGVPVKRKAGYPLGTEHKVKKKKTKVDFNKMKSHVKRKSKSDKPKRKTKARNRTAEMKLFGASKV